MVTLVMIGVSVGRGVVGRLSVKLTCLGWKLLISRCVAVSGLFRLLICRLTC